MARSLVAALLGAAINSSMSELAASPEENLVHLWWWNPGAGASCRVVGIDDLDVIRAELRSMGAVTWRTDYIPVTIACE
jgi:hypothetical protein